MAFAEPSNPTVRASRVNSWVAWVVGVAVFAARMPFLFDGCGVEPNGWRVLISARWLWLTGAYLPSRFPGYPVQEFACAPLSALGPWALNAASALMSALAAAAFVRLFARLRSTEGVWAALALSFVPAVANAASSSLDYCWGLAFFLCALNAAVDRRTLLAGIFLGLASGCRITYLVEAIPLVLLLTESDPIDQKRRTLLKLALATTATAAFCFAPLWIKWGPGFFHSYAFPYPSWKLILRTVSEALWGRIGLFACAIAVAVACWRWIKHAESPPAVTLSSGACAACLSGIVLYTGVFAAAPLKAGYLIPTLPLVILLAGGALPRSIFRVCCALVMLSSLVGFGRSGVYGGPVFEDAKIRAIYRRHVEEAISKIASFERPALIVSGCFEQELLGRLDDQHFLHTYDQPAVEALQPVYLGVSPVIHTMARTEMAAHASHCDAIYYMLYQDTYNQEETGFDPKELGAKPLLP